MVVSVAVMAFFFGAYMMPVLLGQSFPTVLAVAAVQDYNHYDLMNHPRGVARAMIIAFMGTILVFVYIWLTRKLIRSD